MLTEQILRVAQAVVGLAVKQAMEHLEQQI
jgi:hypothetical protein